RSAKPLSIGSIPIAASIPFIHPHNLRQHRKSKSARAPCKHLLNSRWRIPSTSHRASLLTHFNFQPAYLRIAARTHQSPVNDIIISFSKNKAAGS
ncbi:MAG: hypothetical protein AB7U82_35780, partial [Blastocatellales bacterium]